VLSQRCNVALAVVAPLTDDRTFDYQVGFRLNVLYGPTLRQPANPAAMFLP
jgi:hypothetical protein